MKARIPQGHMVMFMETDLEKSKPFDESNLNDLQKQVFAKLGKVQQDKIREGYRALVKNFDNSLECEFNAEGWVMPEGALDGLARALAPAVRDFYSKDENRKAYDEQMKKQEK